MASDFASTDASEGLRFARLQRISQFLRAVPVARLVRSKSLGSFAELAESSRAFSEVSILCLCLLDYLTSPMA